MYVISMSFVIAKESYRKVINPIQDGKSQMITFNQDILWVDHVQPQPDLAKVVGLNSLLAVQAQSVPGGFKNLRVVQLKHQSLPIGSMYAIYGNIYHQYTPNVTIYGNMDPMDCGIWDIGILGSLIMES